LAERGSYMALWAPNVVEWPVVKYGTALAGMVLVALNPALREEELEYALSHSGAAILLHADVSRDYRMNDVAAMVSARLPGLLASRCPTRAGGQGPSRTAWWPARLRTSTKS
jgi:fatty-acyl-CoA synthase